MVLHVLYETNFNLRINEDVIDIQLALGNVRNRDGVNGGLIEEGIGCVAVLKELAGRSQIAL